MGNTCGKWVGLLQELRDVCVALSLCSLKRRAPFAPLLVDVRLGGDRQLHNLVALLVYHEQRSGSITMRLVDIGVVVPEHPCNVLVDLLGRDEQRNDSIALRFVDIGGGVQEHLHNVLGALLGCDEHRSGSILLFFGVHSEELMVLSIEPFYQTPPALPTFWGLYCPPH